MRPTSSLVLLTSTLLLSTIASAQSTRGPPEILVYSKTAGYRHDSIPVAIDALQAIASTTNLYTPTFSEDEAVFTSDQLAAYKAIVFLSNSDQVLTSSGEDALTEWLGNGGALVGLHAATACLFNDTAFGVAIGSWFNRHPTIQNATFTKLVEHETVSMLPDRFNTFEEVYSFRSDPRAVNATVLLTVDPDSYVDSDKPTSSGIDAPYYQGTPHPIAWYRDAGSNVDLSNGTVENSPRMNGRMWMTSLGHTNETWRSEIHLQHVEAGLRWALADFAASNATNPSLSPSSTTTGQTPPTASSSGPAASSSTPTSGAAPLTRPPSFLSSMIASVPPVFIVGFLSL